MDENRIILELIIFDMDGLMFDTEEISWHSWNQAFHQFNIKLDRLLFEGTLGLNSLSTKKFLLDVYGNDLPYEEIKRMRDLLSTEYIASKGIPIKKGLLELLEFLRLSGVLISMATSANKERAMKYLSLSNLTGYFDFIICGDQITESKPCPEIFEKVSSYFDIEPRNCLVLEDSENGILAAQKACMNSIIVPDLKKPSREIVDMTLLELRNLNDVKLYLESHAILKRCEK